MHKRIFLLAVLIATAFTVVTATKAKETPTARKTPQEIEAHKAQLRQEKSALIEQHKAELRAQKAPQIEQQREEARRQKQEQLEAERARLQAQKRQDELNRLNKQEADRQKSIQNRQEVVTRHAALMEGKFRQYSERLTLLMEKIEDRAAELAARGYDTGAVLTAVGEARAALAVADQKAAEAVVTLETMDLSDPQNLGAELQRVKAVLREARAGYSEVLQSLKAAFTEMMSLVEATGGAAVKTEETVK